MGLNSGAKTVRLKEKIPALESANEFIVEDTSGKVEVVTRNEVMQYDPDRIASATPKPFQRDIIDGANVAERYLEREFPYMYKFFKERGIDDPAITYDFSTPNEKWLKVDFPLPRYHKDKQGNIHRFAHDKEAFVFVLNRYPDAPPIGFFVTKESAHTELFDRIFETHKYGRAILEEEHVSEELEKHWDWICFHYNDNQWNYSRSDVTQGDSLTYFFYYIYYRLVGVKGVSSES